MEIEEKPKLQVCELPKGMALWEADAIRNTFRKACTDVALHAQEGNWTEAANARAVSESLMRCWPTLGLGAYSEIVF